MVPTMGFLHEGHLSLVKKARSLADRVIVSIFVNPAQFNSKDDLANYPESFEDDLKKLEECAVDIVFHPSINEVYPGGLPSISLDYVNMTNKMCGQFRPGHFQGVLLIVHNLLLWARPDFASFW